MNIALDYDGTFTAAPNVFIELVKNMQTAGHKVYIVTMRYPSECAIY